MAKSAEATWSSGSRVIRQRANPRGAARGVAGSSDRGGRASGVIEHEQQTPRLEHSPQFGHRLAIIRYGRQHERRDDRVAVSKREQITPYY
jgi:hypothetical protein